MKICKDVECKIIAMSLANISRWIQQILIRNYDEFRSLVIIIDFIIFFVYEAEKNIELFDQLYIY